MLVVDNETVQREEAPQTRMVEEKVSIGIWEILLALLGERAVKAEKTLLHALQE